MRGALLCLVLLLAGCQGDIAVSPPEKQRTLFQPDELGSFVNMNQGNAERHFVSGIYTLEANSWRWAGRRAVLRLRLHETKDLKLVMKFAVPGQVIAKNGPVRLRIDLNGRRFEELRYEKDGIYEWEKPAPADLLKADAENILAIEIDKPLPPDRGPELGFILVYAGLQPAAWKP
jgi:hypothetical protein